jgi:hypothetical protein
MMLTTISSTLAVAGAVLAWAALVYGGVFWWCSRRPRGRDLDATNAKHYRIESDDEPE